MRVECSAYLEAQLWIEVLEVPCGPMGARAGLGGSQHNLLVLGVMLGGPAEQRHAFCEKIPLRTVGGYMDACRCEYCEQT